MEGGVGGVARGSGHPAQGCFLPLVSALAPGSSITLAESLGSICFGGVGRDEGGGGAVWQTQAFLQLLNK